MPEFLARLDRASPTRLRTINLLISLFVLVPHILAYFLAKPGEIEGGVRFWTAMAALDVLAVIVLVSCLVTFWKPENIQRVLRLQSILLSVMAAGLFVWGVEIAIQGIPEGNFAFNPILYVFLCAYPVYLLRRFAYSERLSESWFLNHSHVLAAGAALLIGAAIFTSFPALL